MPSGGLYNPYHLLGEPETAIDKIYGTFFGGEICAWSLGWCHVMTPLWSNFYHKNPSLSRKDPTTKPWNACSFEIEDAFVAFVFVVFDFQVGEKNAIYQIPSLKLTAKAPDICYFRPYLGRWSILTNIFQMGWNHQLDEFPFGFRPNF